MTIKKLSENRRIRQAFKMASNRIEILFELCSIFEKKGNHRMAGKALDRIIRLEPNSAKAWSNKGLVLANLGKYERAIKCEDKAVSIDPSLAGAWFNKGLVLVNLRNLKEAIECYNEVIRIDPNSLVAWTNKGLAFEDLGRYEEAIECFNRVTEINPNFAPAWGEKGVTYAQLGKDEEAIRCYENHIMIDPSEAKAWVNKGISLCKLKRYGEAVRSFEEAIGIEHTLLNAWLGKGFALAGLKEHQAEVQCYDTVIGINPRHIEAWFNKGVALFELHMFEEAIRCYDEVLKIDRSHSQAWSNKSALLGRLGKHSEALTCAEKASTTNPDLAESYANKGVALLNLHRYAEAVYELTRAKQLFSKYGQTDMAEEIARVKLVAENALQLMSRMKTVDEMFLRTLKSKTLGELAQRNVEASTELDAIVKDSRTKRLPKDAYDLVLAKSTCFAALSRSLRYQNVDLDSLRNAKKTFEKWGFTTFVMAVNSIENFIIALKEYGRLAEIPDQRRDAILSLLRPLDTLDGILTQEISSKIKGEDYYTVKPAVVKAETRQPQIIYKYLEDTKKDKIRFCLVQLDFSVRPRPPPEEFDLSLENMEETRNKIMQALEIAEKNDVDVICFPELSFKKQWISEIVDHYRKMTIVGGSYYEGGYNVCPIMIDGDYVFNYQKIRPSPFENPETTGRGMKSGTNLYIFQTRCGRFSVLTCIDYASLSYTVCNYVFEDGRKIDFIINPCYDENISRFQSRGNVDCEDYGVDVIQVNKAPEKGKYGGTCIIGKEHEIILKKLREEGFKPSDPIKYKLFEVGAEKMAIVDFDLRMKAPPVNLSIDYCGRIRISKERFFEYKNGRWSSC